MRWESVRLRRLPLYALGGTYRAVPLTYPEGFDRNATFVSTIELHPLRFSADTGLHMIYVSNTNDEEVEIDHWNANLDINKQNQMVTFPFWSLERLFENNGEHPIEAVGRLDNQTLIVTLWHGFDRVTTRQFTLIKIGNPSK
jgi:hypothetical protein